MCCLLTILKAIELKYRIRSVWQSFKYLVSSTFQDHQKSKRLTAEFLADFSLQNLRSESMEASN